MPEQDGIQLWDYWVDYQIKRAYCVGVIDGIMYFCESGLILKEREEYGNESN